MYFFIPDNLRNFTANLETMITLQNHTPKQVLHVKLSPCFLDENVWDKFGLLP